MYVIVILSDSKASAFSCPILVIVLVGGVLALLLIGTGLSSVDWFLFSPWKFTSTMRPS